MFLKIDARTLSRQEAGSARSELSSVAARIIRAAFSEQLIEKTHSHFVTECVSYAAQKNYHAYLIRQWQIVVAVPSYMVSLEDFAEDMKRLLQKLLEAKGDYIPIIYVACVIDGCAVETVKSVYDAARLEKKRKNISKTRRKKRR